MPNRYQDVYPSKPLLDSAELTRPCAADLLTLEYFEAAPAAMPARVFAQHHVLLNLRAAPTRVENVRDGVHRDFIFAQDEIVVTPAGMRSGWRWHERSQVIVVTLEPEALERFARREVGVLLSDRQLREHPQFEDPDLCRAAVHVRDALASRDLGSELLYESLARVFLVKLLQRVGEPLDAAPDGAAGLDAQQYKKVLDFVAAHFHRQIAVEELATEAALSPAHFSRVFKRTIGESPHRFVMSYRVEKARALLADPDLPLTSIALRCGFSDQAHFSRTFKAHQGETPSAYRAALAR
ncbi:MAG: AraC family transcriptional regulator [Acidobacteriota bacterium]